MTDLLAMSSAIIDGATGTANNRVNHELSVIRDDVAFVKRQQPVICAEEHAV